MKKVLFFLLVTFVAQLYAVKSPKELWQSLNLKRKAQCLIQPDKYRCSADEQKKARKWLVENPAKAAAIITAILSIPLAYKGIEYGQKKREEREQKRKLAEVTTGITPLDRMTFTKGQSSPFGPYEPDVLLLQRQITTLLSYRTKIPTTQEEKKRLKESLNPITQRLNSLMEITGLSKNTLLGSSKKGYEQLLRETQ